MKRSTYGLTPLNTSKLFVLLVQFFLLTAFCLPVSAHNVMMAESKWFLGKDHILAVIELPPSLLAEIKDITKVHYNIETCSEKELQEVATRVIQPYLNQKLSISVNDKKFPVKVLKIERKNDLQWEMWITLTGINFNLPENVLSIDYRLFFEETDDAHFNLAYMYLYDATAQAVPGTTDHFAFLARTTFDAVAHVWETSIKGPAATHGPSRKPFWTNIAQPGRITFLLALVIGLSFFKKTVEIIYKVLRSTTQRRD